MSEDPPPRKGMVRPPSRGGAARAAPQRLKTAKRRTASSQAWLERQLNDPFVAEARAQGYRSRAAFKLAEIDDRAHVIPRGGRVADLGCAPGGWLQVALQRGAAQVVGVDLLEVAAAPGVVLIQGDFTAPDIQARVRSALGGPADLVLSDMAPNTTGHRTTDHLRIMGLIESAVDFAFVTLAPGGAFVAKAFQGGETEALLRRLKGRFASVRNVKPRSSRAESSEVYIVAKGFRPA